MAVVAKSDNSTGNASYSSYVLQSRDIRFVFTAPYRVSNPSKDNEPHPKFSAEEAHAFFAKHGLGIRAVGKQHLMAMAMASGCRFQSDDASHRISWCQSH